MHRRRSLCVYHEPFFIIQRQVVIVKPPLVLAYRNLTFRCRIKYYHLFSWSVSLLFSVAPFMSNDVSFTYGFWFVNRNSEDIAVCWINTSTLDSPVWGMFIVPLLLVYIVCCFSLYAAYLRLKLGITRTFLPRIKILITNTANDFILIIYWLLVLILFALAYATQNPDLDRIVMFLLASKGLSALFVYIIVKDINVKLSNEETVEANKALREEVLNFATAGIRSSTREAHRAGPERLKVTRRPRQGHIPTDLT
jgi:hypothetical protein